VVTNVFIASSARAKHIAKQVRDKLAARPGIHVNAWMDVFKTPTVGFIETVNEQLRANRYFVTILTPDAEVHREETKEVVYKVGSDNVIFEAGAAFGRHGFQRLYFIWDKHTKPPTDLGLDGRLCFMIDIADSNLAVEIDKIAAKIAAVIEEDTRKPRINDGRVRFLSLMECKFGMQRNVIKKILQFQTEAAEKWYIEYEQCGIVWGEPDDYLLFSAPNVDASSSFLTSLRHRYSSLIDSVDSRLVFPGSYWRRPLPFDGEAIQTLVLLRCNPLHVEDVFNMCISLAEKPARGYDDVKVTNIAIMYGPHDVMLMTRAPNVQRHEAFIEEVFQRNMVDGHLAKNTTSIRITPVEVPVVSIVPAQVGEIDSEKRGGA
jgi:hypothetical protein